MRGVVIRTDKDGDLARGSPFYQTRADVSPNPWKTLGIGHQRSAYFIPIGRKVIEENFTSVRTTPAV
jgi:hypothetical protein